MDSTSAVAGVQRNFILQQGLEEPSAASCPRQYSSLMFQPRLVFMAVIVAVILKSPPLFLALAGVLWWNAIFPRWNPIDALFNRIVAVRPGRIALSPAPAPRRFAQGMAGTFALFIGISLLLGWQVAAIVLEVLLILAVGALVFGSFCLGSFTFHLLRGRLAFAKRTLPWARDPMKREP
jgi:Domain of unknown function (DUF4395)